MMRQRVPMLPLTRPASCIWPCDSKPRNGRAELRRAFEDFQAEEKHIRSQYARAVRTGEAPPGADDDELLERPTRRFVIDRMLHALDWNPDDPGQVVEEARSWDADDERLYFDYLGVAPETRAPVVLVEAKAYDVGAARQPRGERLDARTMADVISGAISDLKTDRKDHLSANAQRFDAVAANAIVGLH
jgi:hypothetical protein